jgi:hypothetical protein
VLDLDDNDIEAMNHGRAARWAAAIIVTAGP